MLLVEKLFNDETPFAVMQYFENFKGVKDVSCKKFELLYIRDKEVAYKILDSDSMDFVNQNLNRIKEVIKNKDGTIWEFNNFKAFKEQQLIEH